MTGYPATRAYRTRVRGVSRLTPGFTRITLGDPELAHFGTGGLDQRIKLLLPPAGGVVPEVGQFERPLMEWYRRWRALPDERRGVMRTYTVRAVRPAEATIDIDFALHGAEGPASSWAAAAAPGDELIVIGPDARAATSGGIEWQPGSARRVLLAGDETAAPAIAAILERLDASYRGHAFIEVPTAADMLDVATRADIEVTWLPRGRRTHGARLEERVRAWGATLAAAPGEEASDPDPDAILWDVPERAPTSERYAWLAGEAGVITTLRRHLVRDLGIDRRAVAFMGYWRRGRAEAN